MSYIFANFPDYLATIREKPGMYTGGRSITSLHLLLSGFGMAEYQYAIPESKRLSGFDFNAFEDWIAANYNPERLSAGSYYLARVNAGSEEAGFLLWFQWYDEFRKRASPATSA